MSESLLPFYSKRKCFKNYYSHTFMIGRYRICIWIFNVFLIWWILYRFNMLFPLIRILLFCFQNLNNHFNIKIMNNIKVSYRTSQSLCRIFIESLTTIEENPKPSILLSLIRLTRFDHATSKSDSNTLLIGVFKTKWRTTSGIVQFPFLWLCKQKTRKKPWK